MHVIHPFSPIYDANSKVLILGSIPSVKSRENNFYYANKTNRFWKIFEYLFNVKLENNEEKIDFLLENNIALWDTLKSCDIKGSSDSKIKNIELNDINKIINNSNVKVIFCTGKLSYNTLIKNYKTNIPIKYLKSPSSANASFSLNELIDDYRIILEYLKR